MVVVSACVCECVSVCAYACVWWRRCVCMCVLYVCVCVCGMQNARFRDEMSLVYETAWLQRILLVWVTDHAPFLGARGVGARAAAVVGAARASVPRVPSRIGGGAGEGRETSTLKRG